MDFIQMGYVMATGRKVSLSSLWLEKLLKNLSRPEPDMENCKFAIVGILGDSNSGKSFLMNALAEYLRREEEDDHKWIDNQQVKNLSGFALHEDRLTCNISEGIYMWPRPFILKKPCDNNSEENVAILLLDINMNNITPGLEVLMCLLCSTLIYNKTCIGCPDISRILKIRSEILNFKVPWGQPHPKDIVFQHLMVVFRDAKQKFGKDKSLNYLSEVMNMERNIQWKEELEKIPGKSCFLLKQPLAENEKLEFDKTFINQLKVLAKDMLTIDDLPLKTLKNVAMSLKEFVSNTVFLDMFIPDVVTAFNKLPYQETNCRAEDMEVDDVETSRGATANNDEDIKSEIETGDHEMEDVSETFEEANGRGNPDSPVVPFQNSNIVDYEYKELSKDFERCSVIKPYKNENPESMSVSRRTDFNQRIENILLVAARELESNLFSESEQSKSIGEIIETFRNDAKMNIETFFASYKVNTPVGLLRDIEKRLEGIINEAKKIWSTRNSTAEKSNVTSNADAEFPKENLRNDSEIANEYSNYVTEALKSYSKKMADFLSSGKYTQDDAKEFYDQLVANIITDVHTNWVGKVTIDDNMNSQILQKLEESFKLNVERHDRIQNSVEKTWKCFDKIFYKECENLVKSGDFIRKEADAIFCQLLIKSLPSELPYYEKPKVIQKVKTLPKTRRCIQRFKNVQNCAKQFASEMKRVFQLYNFFEEEKLDKILQETELKIIKDTNLDDVEGKIFNFIVRVVKSECKTINKNIIVNEKKILEYSVTLRITNFYNEEMKILTQNRMSLADLQNAHEKLRKECIEAAKKACSYNESNYRHLKSSFQKIEVSLENAFEIYKSGNELKKDIFMAKVNLVVKKTHDNYIHTMSTKLKQKSMTQREIEELHKATLNEASIVLKKDLMPYQEDSDILVQSLRVLTTRNFEFFVEENQKRIGEEEKENESEKRERKKQEALEKIAEKERRETFGRSSNSNSAMHKRSSEGSPPRHSEANQKFSRETSNYESKSTTKTKSPIIAVEFGMRTVKIGVMLDGKFLNIPDRWGDMEFPNTVGITYDDEILIGREASNASRVNLKGGIFDIADIFYMSSDELPRQMMDFLGTDILITKELLCGLILSRVKTEAEIFLKSTVDSVVLTVPLCYTSTQRQAAKDAARIGGFSTVHLITEPTAAALAYAQQPLRMNSENHFLVIVADNNCGVILDAAVYLYKEGKVKMVTCAGSSHHEVQNVLRKCMEEVRNKVLGESVKKLIKSFLKECVEDKYIAEFALICREGEDKSKILRIVNELCKNARPAFHLATDAAVLMGAAIFAELWSNGEKVAKSHISDLLPFRFECQRESAHSKRNSVVFPRHDRLPLTERWNSFAFESFSGCLKYNVWESGNVCNYHTAELVVPICSSVGHKRNGSVNFYVNWEGILRVTAHYTDPKEEIVINHFSLNMNEEKIAQNASLVAFVAPNPRLEEERRLFNDSKSELRASAEFILHNLEQVQSVFGKDQLEKRSTAAIEALDHPNITQEDVSNRISVLTKLKSKYNL